MENKKTKLTISGSPKKTLKTFDNPKVQGKKTVIIGNATIKATNKELKNHILYFVINKFCYHKKFSG